MTEKVVWYKRIWTRAANDIIGGPMSSMHGHIRVDDKSHHIKGELIFRDCESQMSYEHWVQGTKYQRTKALRSLYRVRDMINAYIEAFEKVCKEADDEGHLK